MLGRRIIHQVSLLVKEKMIVLVVHDRGVWSCRIGRSALFILRRKWFWRLLCRCVSISRVLSLKGRVGSESAHRVVVFRGSRVCYWTLERHVADSEVCLLGGRWLYVQRLH